MAFTHPVLPYRTGVGIMLADGRGHVLVRQGCKGEPATSWGMPEGSIGAGESEREAALRVLQEQTGIAGAKVLAQAPGWFTYELPCDQLNAGVTGQFSGLRQKWFALQLLDGRQPTASLDCARDTPVWRWVPASQVPEMAAAYKRQLYEDVIATFAPLMASEGGAHQSARASTGPTNLALQRPKLADG